MAGVKRRMHSDSDVHALHKELDDISCPICMDHPHNAVLLLCSSHVKGCRSYICDTSYRHSNCLDRYKKINSNSRNTPTLPNTSPINTHSTSSNTLDLNLTTEGGVSQNTSENNATRSVGFLEGSGVNNIQEPNRNSEPQVEGVVETGDSESLQERTEHEDLDAENSSESKLSLKCPMCRGDVLGWEVVEDARTYLNKKKRSCSRESCSFSGNYQELRRHARRVHPTTRPSEVDPSRERAWRRLEHQREYGDIVSAIRSAMPGAVVVGDYVIENGDRVSAEREGGGGGGGEVSSPFLTTLFLFQMIGAMDSGGEPRGRSRVWPRHRRSSGALSERRFLWGENLLGMQDDDDEGDAQVASDAGEDASPVPRRRRRLTRSRSDEDQS